MIDIYQYVADNDPNAAMAIINKYGYSTVQVDTSDDLAKCLEDVCSMHGADVLRDIVSVHPDRDLIVEVEGVRSAQSGGAEPCGCAKCKEKSAVEQYVAAAQGKPADNNGSMMSLHQGNLFLIGAALILAVAIITSSNKS